MFPNICYFLSNLSKSLIYCAMWVCKNTLQNSQDDSISHFLVIYKPCMYSTILIKAIFANRELNAVTIFVTICCMIPDAVINSPFSVFKYQNCLLSMMDSCLSLDLTKEVVLCYL